MKKVRLIKTVVILIFLLQNISFAQIKHYSEKYATPLAGNYQLKKIVIQNYEIRSKMNQNTIINNGQFTNNTHIRWSYTDPVSIGQNCSVSGNSNKNVTGWSLNNERASLYNNINSNPVWEYFTGPLNTSTFVTINNSGNVIGESSEKDIFLFNDSSNVPFFNFDVTTLPDSGYATLLDLTNDGRFIVFCSSYEDSSTIIGFDVVSNNIVWSKRICPQYPTLGAWITGIKISTNDSSVIVNNCTEFYVIKTFTGEIAFQGFLDPANPTHHTQSMQGISGDGKVIATINNYGLLRVYQWNGVTYNFLWQDAIGSWYTSVDITYDGKYVAAGTLDFIPPDTYEGRVILFKTNENGTPYWISEGLGDFVSELSFSKSGNILSASSWGAIDNSEGDLYIFKTFLGASPVFKVNSPGSLFSCKTSEDGSTVIASGKAVHARIFGNGGLLYNVEVDTSDVIASLNYNGLFGSNRFNIYQNYPNPFNPTTKIKFDLPDESNVNLAIYDITGRAISVLVNEILRAGVYEYEWNAYQFPSGTYFYRIQTGSFSQVKKMALVK